MKPSYNFKRFRFTFAGWLDHLFWVKYLWWECQSRLFNRPAHTQAFMSAVESRHRRRKPPSATVPCHQPIRCSRLTSSLVVFLRRDIVTHHTDNVQFCSPDSLPCRIHSSLAVVLSLKVVSIVSKSFLFPFCSRFAATILQFSRSSPFVGYLPLLYEPAFKSYSDAQCWTLTIISVIKLSAGTARLCFVRASICVQ